MKKYILIAAVLLAMTDSLLADKDVTKTTFINLASHPKKSMEQIKTLLLQKVKMDSATEIFGDFIKEETAINNGNLIKDRIISEQNGIVHLRDEPVYAMGQNFGDIQVTVHAYATDKDVADMSVQTIMIDEYVFSNPNIPLKDLKRAAEDAFIINAMAQQKPELKKAYNAASVARSLATSFNIASSKFDVDTVSYTMSGEVKYIPFFLNLK